MVLGWQGGMGLSIEWLDEERSALMKGILLRWLARYDAWCEEWGLTPENRRCCMPVRYDDDETKKAAPECDAESLNQNCESRRQ